MTNPITLHQVRTLAFGPGCATQCVDYIGARAARSAFVVTSPPLRSIAEPLIAALMQRGCSVTTWSDIAQEPSITDFEAALAAARNAKAEVVIGLGGGSAMDVAKLIAAFVDGKQSLRDTFGIGKLQGRSTQLICLPTTSGTGSEVSPIAILLDESDELKKGVISEHLVPDAAFVDPLLTISMPPAVTASTGLDALTHCIEAFANRAAHPLVDTWALEGIRLISKHLVRAVKQGDDIEARSAMSQASLYGGLCLGPVNTAAVHALAYPLGGEFHVAHGISNSVLLPHVLNFNLPAAPTRYAQVALAMGIQHAGTDLETAQLGVQRITELSQACDIPTRLRDFGIDESAIDRMAKAAMTVTRLLDRNVRVVSEQDARDIYRRAL